jgi:hypothetical protein
MKLFRLLGSIAVNEGKPLPEGLSTAPPNADPLEQLNLAPSLDSQYQVGIVMPKPAGRWRVFPNLARGRGRYYFPSPCPLTTPFISSVATKLFTHIR